MKTWRDIANPIIAGVLKTNKGRTDKEIRKALREAYPWGERAMHPYKIWCDEIKVQMGTKKKKLKEFNPNQLDIERDY